MDYKYRVDFYYWNCGSGFSHVETYAYKNTYVEAKECVNNINKNIFKKYPHDDIWIKIVDNENDYVVSEWWENKDIGNKDHDENWWTMRYLTGNNTWVYEREDGDCGIVVAKTYEDALNELRKVYNDIDERLELKVKGYPEQNYEWGLSIRPINDYDIKGNVIITTPY
jgi:hypothetical protein